jgi:DNA polymerase I-like protein with 3'-5' exonuclease and polymerase domains
MGPKTLVSHAYDAGHVISFADAKKFHQAYWHVFSGMRSFSQRMSKLVKAQGFVINAFGYRCTPEPHKAFNAVIQSSVSGLINVLCLKLLHLATYASLITVIHDELLLEVPDDKVDEFRTHLAAALASLNDDLGWTIKIRTGMVVGKDWYDAK